MSIAPITALPSSSGLVAERQQQQFAVSGVLGDLSAAYKGVAARLLAHGYTW